MRNVESLVEVDDRSKKGERRLPVLNRRIASCPKWHGHFAHVWRFLRTTGETPVPLLGCALPSGTEHTMTRTADEVVVQNRIHLICGQKVMLDSELAGLYGVETKTLNRAVRRHIARFPDDFLLHLTRKEVANLRYQIGTSSLGYGGGSAGAEAPDRIQSLI